MSEKATCPNCGARTSDVAGALRRDELCPHCGADLITGEVAQLEVEQVWVIGCSRCANESLSYAESENAAKVEFAAAGWTRAYCPQCNGVRP